MNAYKLYKCQICGDPYPGDDARDSINKFEQENNFSREELDNSKAALDIEIGNASLSSRS